MDLQKEEKKYLLDIAFLTIESRLRGREMPAPLNLPVALAEKRGAFVTWKKKGKLRGCIGYIEARKPLCQAVAELALTSAFGDSRFRPVKADELADLSVEISVLTPLREVRDVNEIIIGTHGLYLERGLKSGLLLPQVAAEHEWDRHTFLSETCRKAGLDAEAWRDPETTIFSFTAEVFNSGERW